MSFLLPCGGIMNNIDLLKTITNYKKIKNPAYPAQESLLIHLYIRVNDKIQSIIENELSEYRINTSTFMVLVSLYMSVPFLYLQGVTILQNKHHTHHRQIRKKEYCQKN